MALYIVPLSGILMGVLVLDLIFFFGVVTHKGNSLGSALQSGPGNPSQTDHISAEHAALCCTVLPADSSCYAEEETVAPH